MTATTGPNQMPPQVTRPLFRGAFAVLCMMIIVVGGAGFVPLATTLTLEGRLVSSQPEVVLQPPYGGPVAVVGVARHDTVVAGQVLVQLDTTVEVQQVAAVRTLQGQLQRENAIISSLLDVAATDQTAAGPDEDSPYYLQMQLAREESAAQVQSAAALAEQVALLEGQVALTVQQLAGMRARAERQEGLVQQGVLKRTDAEVEAEQILMVAAEIEGNRRELAALRDRQVQTAAQARMVLLQARQSLMATRARNLKQLEDIERQLADLEDRIARAVIRAPMSGTVTRLDLQARDAYAARGKTILAIAQPLANPHVEVSVPTTYIDQLQPGMQGRLVLPSLPQRAMPQIEAQLAAISPRAGLDEAGQPTGYAARATLSADAADQLKAALSDLRLSEDMPVQLTIEVRETTLAQYLLGPFSAAFQRALQD